MLLREELRWLIPEPFRMVYGLTGWPRLKAGAVMVTGAITAWGVTFVSWFARLSVVQQVVGVVLFGLLGAIMLGMGWHWLEGRFLKDDAKRRRLAYLYHQWACCSLDHVLRMWNTIREPTRDGLTENAKRFAEVFRSLDGIVTYPIIEHRARLEAELDNPASSLDEIMRSHQVIFQYHWRALLWIHATMGFVGLTPDGEQYRAMMKAHDEYSRAARLFALQPGFRRLGKVLRTLNREREMVVTPWTVRYE